MPIPSPRVPETVGKHSGKPKQVRISKKVREAIDLMVMQGLKRSEAAERAGLKDNSLYIAMRKPEVKALLRERLADLRESEAARSIARVADLADESGSDHVKLEANKFLLGIEGIRPSEHHVHDHTVKVVPGYVLDPGGPDLRRPEHMRDVTSAPQLIEGEGQEVPASAEGGQSMQHEAFGDNARPQDVGGQGGRDDPS